MNFELHKFKKISDDKKSAVLQHPLGHKITIAKNVLSPELKKQVESLKLHMADGGEVTDDLLNREESSLQDRAKSRGLADERQKSADGFSAEFPQPKPVQMAEAQPNQPNIIINNTPPPQQPAPQAAPAVPQSQPQQVAQAQPAQDQRFNPVNQTQPDPYGANAYSAVSKEGLQNQIEGINETAGAQNQQNLAVAKEHDAMAQAKQKAFDDSVSYQNDLRQEHKAFVEDYKNSHIDPSRLLSNMKTGQKISTAIGLFLGGLGSGFTHTSNSALDFLNKQIENDVEAQKAELGKRNNLLSANVQQFGNETQAVGMTTAMLNSVAADKIESAALKTGNPVLIAKAKQAAGELEAKNAAIFGQMAARQSLQNGSQGKSQSMNERPAEKIRMLGMSSMMTPTEQEHAFKELKEAESVGAARENLLSTFDKVNQVNTVKNRAWSPLDTKRQVDSMVKPLVAGLSKETAGKFSEADAGFIQTLFPEVGDSAETIATKRQQLEKIISQKMHFPILDAYQINPSSKNLYKPGGELKVTEGAPVLPK